MNERVKKNTLKLICQPLCQKLINVIDPNSSKIPKKIMNDNMNYSSEPMLIQEVGKDTTNSKKAKNNLNFKGSSRRVKTGHRKNRSRGNR